MKKLLIIVMVISSMKSFAGLSKEQCENLPLAPGRVIEVIMNGPFDVKTDKKSFALGKFAVRHQRNKNLPSKGFEILRVLSTSWEQNQETLEELWKIDQGFASIVPSFEVFIEDFVLGWDQLGMDPGNDCYILPYSRTGDPDLSPEFTVLSIGTNRDGKIVMEVYSGFHGFLEFVVVQ